MTEPAYTPSEVAWAGEVDHLAREALTLATALGQSQGAPASQVTCALVLSALRLAVAHGSTPAEAAVTVRTVLRSWETEHRLGAKLRVVS